MNRPFLLFALVALVAGSLLVGAAWAATQAADVDWYVLGGGGVVASTGGPLSLSGTIGQAVAGWGSADLCAGFWCDAKAGPRYAVYLPVAVRH